MRRQRYRKRRMRKSRDFCHFLCFNFIICICQSRRIKLMLIINQYLNAILVNFFVQILSLANSYISWLVYITMQVSFQQRYFILPGFPVGERVVVSLVSPVIKEYNDFMRVKNYVEG